MSFTAEQIMAFADGELDAVTAKRIEQAMQSDPSLSAQIAAHRNLREKLGQRFAPVLDEPVPDRLLDALVKVDTSMADRRARRSGFSSPLQWGAIAATLIIGLFAGYQLQPDSMITEKSGALIAHGRLESTLESQLASNQSSKAPIRIGLTFRDDEGVFCRSFESRSFAGIACKAGNDWQLRQTFEGVDPADYRLASSGEVAQAVEQMMSEDGPLDARQETSARNQGWRAAKSPESRPD